MRSLALAPFIRFGIIGCLATAVHTVSFVGLVQVGLSGILSNLVAYSVAVGISYVGHSRWTFASKGKFHRFAVTSLLGLALNSAISFFLVDLWGLPAWVAAIVMLIVTPTLTFLALRLWVFSGPDRRGADERRTRSA